MRALPRGLILPLLSGAALLAGLASGWLRLEIAAAAFFWGALVLGAATFVPGALRGLLRGRIGIGLLMTISAVGAVILGHVAEAAALAFLYGFAEALEDSAMDRARGSLRSLLELTPALVTVPGDNGTRRIAVTEIKIGQIFMVSPGENIATDGVVTEGRSYLDISVVTGESIPLGVEPGSPVVAGSINTSGALSVRATAAGMDNSLTRIVSLVEQAQAVKGNRARWADRIARPLIPGVILLAIAVGLLGSLWGDPSVWITRALVVLVAASPCALAISVPVTVVSAIGAASRFGVVFKTGAAYENLGSVTHLALDKTGTLTRNQPRVGRVLTRLPGRESEILGIAAALESHSGHPLALAITAAAPRVPRASDVTETAGWGLTGVVDNQRVAVGSPRWLAPGQFETEVADLEAAGFTCVVVCRQDEPVGVIALRDELRPESAETVAMLRDRGYRVSLLTGDNRGAARSLGAQAGISDIHAELRPLDKAAMIRGFSRDAPTAMIGDGFNDAPALAEANVGIAVGAAASDAARATADMVFLGRDLRLIPRALDHARKGHRIISQNIALSLVIIVTLIPLAITGILGLASVVLIHEVAEVFVIANGLRAARIPRVPLGPDPR